MLCRRGSSSSRSASSVSLGPIEQRRPEHTRRISKQVPENGCVELVVEYVRADARHSFRIKQIQVRDPPSEDDGAGIEDVDHIGEAPAEGLDELFDGAFGVSVVLSTFGEFDQFEVPPGTPFVFLFDPKPADVHLQASRLAAVTNGTRA